MQARAQSGLIQRGETFCSLAGTCGDCAIVAADRAPTANTTSDARAIRMRTCYLYPASMQTKWMGARPHPFCRAGFIDGLGGRRPSFASSCSPSGSRPCSQNMCRPGTRAPTRGCGSPITGIWSTDSTEPDAHERSFHPLHDQHPQRGLTALRLAQVGHCARRANRSDGPIGG